MEVLRSMESTRSMPSRVMFSIVEAVWGLNNATVRPNNAAVRQAAGHSMPTTAIHWSFHGGTSDVSTSDAAH